MTIRELSGCFGYSVIVNDIREGNTSLKENLECFIRNNALKTSNNEVINLIKEYVL